MLLAIGCTPTCIKPFHLSGKYNHLPPERLVSTQPHIYGHTRAGWTQLTMTGNATLLNPNIFWTLMKCCVTVFDEITWFTRRSALHVTLNHITWCNLAGVSHTADKVKYIIQCIYLPQCLQDGLLLILLHSPPILRLHLSACNMATLCELELHLKSIQNIGKQTFPRAQCAYSGLLCLSMIDQVSVGSCTKGKSIMVLGCWYCVP